MPEKFNWCDVLGDYVFYITNSSDILCDLLPFRPYWSIFEENYRIFK